MFSLFFYFLQIDDEGISNALLQFLCWFACEIAPKVRKLYNMYLRAESTQIVYSSHIAHIRHREMPYISNYIRENFVLETAPNNTHFFIISEFFCLIRLRSTLLKDA